ncbi:unnamed protein product [Orchesella dallaii]|uniref:C2H2-type domain-containing protein n=1 Tax=Orchesella dallaii TaxID=48710 RepID=A0ABP1QL09_9HEXA
MEVKEEPVDFNDDPEQREYFTHPRPPTPFRCQLNEEVEGEEGGDEGAEGYSEMPSTSAGGGGDVFSEPSSSSGLSNAIAQVVNNREGSVAVTTEVTQSHTGLFKKSTCLFCGGMLFVHVNTDQQSVEQIEHVTGLVKNLCHQMRLNNEGFPERCTDNMFPFCSGCKQLLKNSLDLKEEFARKMAESIKKIRDTIIRGESANKTNERLNKPALQVTEAFKFTKFRDMIRDAQTNDYLSNLGLPTANSSSNNNIGIQPNASNKHVQTDPWQPNVDIYDSGNGAVTSTSSQADSDLVSGISEARPGPSRAPPPTPPPDEEIAGPSSATFGLRPGSKGKDKKIQKNIKTMKLTSTSVTAEYLPVVLLDRLHTLQIKQEINERREQHYDLNYDADNDECWDVKKKRKFSYRGVGIYSCFDKNGLEFVQCGSCKFHRPIEKIPKGEFEARNEVKLHIKNTHAPPPPPEPKIPLQCNTCDEILDSKVALRYHQRNHQKMKAVIEAKETSAVESKQLKRKPPGDVPTLTPPRKKKKGAGRTQSTSKDKKTKDGNFMDSRTVVQEENENETMPVLRRQDE